MSSTISLNKSHIQRLKEALKSYWKGKKIMERFTSAVGDKRVSKTTQAGLKINESGFSSIIENTGDIIWSFDRDFRFLVCNALFREIVKLQKGSTPMPGDPVELDYFPKQSPELWLDFYDMAF